MLTPIIVVLSIAAFALADTFTFYNHTPKCTEALRGVVDIPGTSTCLNTKGLRDIETSEGSGGNASEAIESWLELVCSEAFCSHDTLAAITKHVIDGCWDDFQGWPTKPTDQKVADITEIVQHHFRVAKDIFCLRNETAFCSLDVLNLMATESVFPIPSQYQMVTTFLRAYTLGVPNFACTDCAKAEYSIAVKSFPGSEEVKPRVEKICGVGFVDGVIPSTINQTANPAVQMSSKALNEHLSENAIVWISGLLLLMHLLLF